MRLQHLEELFGEKLEGFKGATPEGAVTTSSDKPPRYQHLSLGASKEPHPKVRLQPPRLSPTSHIKAASKEPHPKVRLQPQVPGGISGKLGLQRSHTRRCGYNVGRRLLVKGGIGFKGATPEGAVTTGSR